MASGGPIVVESRKELAYLLCVAAEIEHALMTQYLYAAFSLRETPGPGLTPEQLEAVERWRKVILQVSAEEMLHWALVQNLLIAIGSAPFVSRPHLPHRGNGYPPEIQLRLLPFGEAALEHFTYLERPEDVDARDADVFQPVGAPLEPMAPGELQPRGQDFSTQGQLYHAIEAGFARLAAELGDDLLFIGPAFHQSRSSSGNWPDLQPIVDVAGACRAIHAIVEQGEGARGDWHTAHYGRFLGVLEEYRAAAAADPGFRPAHPVVAAGVRAVEGIAPDVSIIDPATAATSDIFNAVYDLLLQMIARYFAFGHETDEQRAVLAREGIGLMFTAIKPLGLLLATMPVGPDHPGTTAGANFQLAYRASFLLPHRRSAWIRFCERLDEIAVAADAVPATGRARAVLDRVGADLRRTSTALAAHIEPVSR